MQSLDADGSAALGSLQRDLARNNQVQIRRPVTLVKQDLAGIEVLLLGQRQELAQLFRLQATEQLVCPRHFDELIGNHCGLLVTAAWFCEPSRAAPPRLPGRA